jgi:methionine sulfoxide reductase heme-binding subunit
MTPRTVFLSKLVLFALCLLPALRLVLWAALDRLGANPIEFITRSTGIWTLVMLCLSLSITPLRVLTGQVWWIRYRRMLGLFCFFYVILHMMTWVWFDHWFELNALIKDVLKRPFIAVGFSAMLLLWPLALTSNAFAMRRLGRRWSRLHQLVYLVAALAMLHFWWMRAGKNNFLEPIIYGSILLTLLGFRIYTALGKTASKANKSASFSR